MRERKPGDMVGARRLRMMTLAEAADAWGVKASTVRQWIKRGKLPQAIRIGNHAWVVPLDTPKPESKRALAQQASAASLPAE